MTIGTVQKEARAELGVTQRELGEMLYLSRSMVNEIEAGRKRMPKDAAPRAAQIMDCGFYNMEIAEEMTGGGWAGKLDGENVDLHRSSVALKATEELNETQEAVQRLKSMIINCPASLDAERKNELKEQLLQVMDSIVALPHLVTVICKEYGLSWFGLWKEWKLKAKRRGYVK